MTPQMVVADSTSNVLMRDGALVNRPGMKQLTANTVTGRPMGVQFFQISALSRIVVVGTTVGWYSLNQAVSPFTFTDLTGGTALTGDGDNFVQFTVFPQGNDMRLIGVNGHRNNVPKYWIGTGNYASLGGTPYAAQDVTTAANRVLLFHTMETAVEYPFRVRHSDFNDSDTWPANNFADLSDTPDAIIAGKALSRVSVGIYKEDTQWVGLAQQGTFPFRYELQDHKPGPVSPAAVVDADGRHFYLARDGSVYSFDGSRCTHIGEPNRRFILKNLNFDAKERTFGFYSRRDRMVYWFFPSVTTDDCDMGVSLHIDTGQFWPHALKKTVACAAPWDYIAALTWGDLSAFTWTNLAATYATWGAMGSARTPVELLGGTGGLLYRFGGTDTDDDGTNFTAQWRFQNMQLGGPSRRFRLESMDSFFEKTSATQTVSLKVGTTDTAGLAPTFPAELTDTFDIGTDNLHQTLYSTDSPGTGTGLPEARFTSVEHSLTSSTNWKWLGGHLRGYPMETE